MLECNPPTALEVVCIRVLDLRERLRIEEIISEIHPDMERLYLDPPSYMASQIRLRDVRILIMQTCQSLAYIERQISLHELNLNLSTINDHRTSQRPPDHPYHIIFSYLKPEAREAFDNYEGFLDLRKIHGGVGAGDWEELSADDSMELGGSSSSYTFDTLSTEYSKILDTPDIHPFYVDKSIPTFEIHDDIEAYQMPQSLSELRYRIYEGQGIRWERPGVVVVV